jgi:hypothetical protein
VRAGLESLRAFTGARPFAVVVGGSFAVAVAVALVRPFENKFPIYLDLAHRLLDMGQHPPNAFWPTGYTTIVYAGIAIDGHTGVIALQVLLHCALAAAAFAALRVLEVAPFPAVLGALFVSVDPQFLIAITRMSDLNLTAPLLLAMVACAVWIRRDGMSPGRAVLLGLPAGALFAVRANLLSVLPVAIILVWPRLRLRPALLGIAATLAVPVATSTFILGHPVLLAANGTYNFAAGANAHTEDALLRHYNAEWSLYAYQRRFHVPSLEPLQEPSKQHELRSFALDYIRDHPGEYAKLTALKVLTVLRPDLRAREAGARSASENVVNLVSALPPLLWLVSAAVAFRLGASTRPLTTRIVGLFAVLYLLPLVLSNPDPRLRYALDAVLLLHVAAIASRLSARGTQQEGRLVATT